MWSDCRNSSCNNQAVLKSAGDNEGGLSSSAWCCLILPIFAHCKHPSFLFQQQPISIMLVDSSIKRRSRALPRRFLIIAMCQTHHKPNYPFPSFMELCSRWGAAAVPLQPTQTYFNSPLTNNHKWHESSSSPFLPESFCALRSTWDVARWPSPTLLFIAGNGILIKCTYSLLFTSSS